LGLLINSVIAIAATVFPVRTAMLIVIVTVVMPLIAISQVIPSSTNGLTCTLEKITMIVLMRSRRSHVTMWRRILTLPPPHSPHVDSG
jgi:hypothetical protein